MPLGNWLGTNTGKVVELEVPPLNSAITLEDIATGISNVCRFNGQIKEFYSVAQHCLNVADLCPPRYALEGLLHDASEAYICDIPTPLKAVLGDAYRAVEDRIQMVIGQQFGADLVHLPDVVKQADKLLCVAEHHALQQIPADWGWDRDMVRVPVNYRSLKIHEVRGIYIERVKHLAKLRGIKL